MGQLDERRTPSASLCNITLVAAGGGTLTIRVDGELDVWTAPTLEVVIDDAIPGAHRICIDLGGISFIDVRGIAVLDAVRRSSPKVVVIRTSAAVDRVFGLTAAAVPQQGARVA